MAECVSYFNSTTQNDIPERLLNRYYPSGGNNLSGPVSPETVAPCNTWICDASAKEYECLGIKYELNLDKSAYVSSYMSLQEWTSQWQDGTCLALFNDILLGLNTTQTNTAFSQNNFYLLQDNFTFMFSRYFNQDISTAYIGPTGPCDPNATVGTPTTGQTGGKFSNADNNCNVYIHGPYPTGSTGGVTGSSGDFFDGFKVVPSGQKGYNTMLDILLTACQDLPGVCEPMQNYMCGECDRESIASNPSLIKLCGCVAPSPPSTAFYNSTLTNYEPACDPLCNRIDTIKTADFSTGVAETCNASVCVIENVTINSIASTGVVPTFNQVCPACANGQGNCICIIDATFNTTIPSVKGNSGESINNQAVFNQYCPNSQCYVNNPKTGAFEQVDCLGTLPKGNVNAEVKVPLWVWILVAVLIIIAIVAILAYRYASVNPKVYYVGRKKY
jgi:hypothetical protein